MSATDKLRVLIVSHDIVGARMAGPGIRVWEMARVLAERQPVTLIAPQPIDLVADAFTCGSYTWGDGASLARWLDRADVVVANGFVLLAHPELGQIKQPLALDLYDPVLLENLQLFRTAPPAERTTQNQQDVALLNRQLAAGDFLLCATERQRDLYLGALIAAGRVTPEITDRDPQLRTLIDVVPFGLPDAPPVKHQSGLRGMTPGIGADDLIVLWSGGLWDWLDPLTLIEAMPTVVAEQPRARLVFLAGQHPGNAHPMQIPAQAKTRARELDLLDRQVFFYEQWVPYERRADVLLDADVAVSLHRDHLETRYAAVRSRFLDHLWSGLPSVVSDGDAAAALVREHGLGEVVAPGDVAGVAQALLRLLNDPAARTQAGQRAHDLAAAFRWNRTLAPLLRFCQAPHRTRPRHVPADDYSTNIIAQRSANEVPMASDNDRLDAVRSAAIAVQEQTWRVQEPSVGGGMLGRIRQIVIQQLVRPYVVPLVQQQQEYNAAVLRTTYTLTESADQRQSLLLAQLAALHERVGRLEHNDRVIRQQLAELIEQLRGLEDADTQLAAQLRQIQDRMPADRVEGRL